MDFKEFENKSLTVSKGALKQPQQAPVEPIVDPNKVKIKKPSEFSKLKRNFFIEDGKTVIGTLFSSVIVPGLKKLFLDGINTAATTALYGSKGQKSSTNGLIKNTLGNISYSSYAQLANKQLQPAVNTIYAVDDILFNSITDAQSVLDELNNILNNDGYISVNRFYDLVGVRGNNPNDVNYGWTNLYGSKILREGDGYRIAFPRVTPLK